MQFKNFMYEVSATIQLTRVEAQLILDAACTHYDAFVRQAAAGGAQARVDGFIYRMYCQVQHDESLPQHLTFRKIDTMCKALEPFLNAKEAMVLFLELKDTLDRINSEFLRICPPTQ